MYMSVLNTVKEMLQASTQNPDRGSTAETSEGAYWCHDCQERLLDTEVEGEGRGENEDPPSCPSCGDEMEFERSPGSTGCAC